MVYLPSPVSYLALALADCIEEMSEVLDKSDTNYDENLMQQHETRTMTATSILVFALGTW